MPIEFRCPTCDQQLRVPDAAAGKNAKCPKCQAIVSVPGASSPPPLTPPASTPPQKPFEAPPSRDAFSTPTGGSFGAAPSSNPFGQSPGASPFGGGAGGGGGGNPFGAGASNPFASEPKGPTISSNPYASPTAYPEPGRPLNAQGIGHQVVEIGDIMNHSMTVWQNNLGLLAGTTFVVFIIGQAIAQGSSVVQFALMSNKMEELAIVLAFITQFVSIAAGVFLGIGQVQISLKLARYQRAEFGDLFKGGSRFLPTLGITLLISLGLVAGCVVLVGGIVLLLFFWPAYYLVIDEKCGVFDSFGVAAKITEQNKLTSFIMWLLSIGIVILGFLACFIGMFFAAPLVSLLNVTAYLMMSGQIPVKQQYVGQA